MFESFFIGKCITIHIKLKDSSKSLNRYSYVEGNPVSYTDPFGLSPYTYANALGCLNGAVQGTGNMPCGPLDREMVSCTYDCRNRPVQAGDTAYKYIVQNDKSAKTSIF